ncbi:MAG TPA: hypothetical protein PKE04_20810, partial [Clostridia bacterium]|nr:hypothetical protein [Clostridia bacterium]
ASDEEGELVWALYMTNILEAEDGLGTYRYTLSLPTQEALDENNPRIAALATMVRRVVELDGSLGDPSDADILQDVEVTKDLGSATGYALCVKDNVLFLYKDGELFLNEPLHKKYRGVSVARNKRENPAIRFTRKDGTTALIPIEPDFVLLFTFSKEPFVFGAGCHIEKLTVNTDIILHNSGLVEDSYYCPDGIWMVGIAIDEEGEPILVDSGMWSTGPRPAHGAWCKVCSSEIKRGEAEYHLVHVCEAPGCQYGGLWASCAKEGNMRPEVHAADPGCPYGLCALCSNDLCTYCQQDGREKSPFNPANLPPAATATPEAPAN